MLRRLMLFTLLNFCIALCSYFTYLLLTEPHLRHLITKDELILCLTKNRQSFRQELLIHVRQHKCFAQHTTQITDHYNYLHTILEQLGCVTEAQLHILSPGTRKPLSVYSKSLLGILVLHASDIGLAVVESGSKQVENITTQALFFQKMTTVTNEGNENALILALHIDRTMVRENDKIIDHLSAYLFRLQRILQQN